MMPPRVTARSAYPMLRDVETHYQVCARSLWAYLDLAALYRVPVDTAFRGMPFDANTVRALSNVSWDDFCVVAERLEDLCGGPERCRQLLEQSYHEVLPELHWLTASVTCPMTFARLTLEMISPIIYQGCSFAVRDTGPHQLHVELRLRQGARPSLTFFRASIGELQALPRHLGLEPASVRADFSAQHGDYELVLPRSGPGLRPAAAAHAAGSALGLAGDAERSPSQLDSPGRADVGARLAAVQLGMGLTPRQSEVLGWVIEGASNKEIAEQLGCAENTIELHVTKLLQKAGVASRARLIAQFWSGFYEHRLHLQ
jgi:DNA-binding CsgD family transcriptional regulator